MSFWNAIFGSSADAVALTVPGIEAYVRRQIPRGIQELVLEHENGGVRLVRVVFDNWHQIENRSIRSNKELEELVLFMWTMKELPLSDRAPPSNRLIMPPPEVVFLEEHCPECAVGLAESVESFMWILPAGHALNCECGARMPAPSEDMIVKVKRSSTTSLVAEPFARASRR